MTSRRFAACAFVIGSIALSAATAEDIEDDEAALLKRGRDALRAMDCARCHGRDYNGWAAASLIAGVRDGSRDRFETIVLDGVPGRGMPGYRSQPVVVRDLDAIYAYLVAKARDGVSDGQPPTPGSAVMDPK